MVHSSPLENDDVRVCKAFLHNFSMPAFFERSAPTFQQPEISLLQMHLCASPVQQTPTESPHYAFYIFAYRKLNSGY